MTEQEVIHKQEESADSVFYLILIGTFLHAYGNGAFALARATGYRVLRRHRKAGDVITAGFPIARLKEVEHRITAAGGTIEALPDAKTWRFAGLDGTPDETMVCQAKEPDRDHAARKSPATQTPHHPDAQAQTPQGLEWLRQELLEYKLATSTPLEAMNFIGTLQQRLKGDAE